MTLKMTDVNAGIQKLSDRIRVACKDGSKLDPGVLATALLAKIHAWESLEFIKRYGFEEQRHLHQAQEYVDSATHMLDEFSKGKED